MNEQGTTSLEQRLGDAFDAIVARELPTSVSVTELIEAGRRQVRRRRARFTFGLGAAMVTAMAVTIGVLVGTAPRGDTAGIAHGAPDASSTAVRMSQLMPAGNDPIAPSVAFGWLPPGHSGEYEISQDETGGSGAQVWGPANEVVAAYTYGPGSASDPTQTHIAAGDVQGHPAFWARGAPGTTQAAASGSLYLAWQYEPGRRAMVMTGNMDTTTAIGDMVLRIAQSLKFGPASPVAMPFHLPALPGGISPESADIDLPQLHGSRVGSADLRLCIVSRCYQTGGLLIRQESTTWMAGSALDIDSAPQAGGGGLPTTGGAPVNVNGHAATLWTNASGATVSFTYEAARVTIQSAGKEYQALGGLNGFLAFCRSMTWFGADPAHWTTNVLG